MKTLITTLMILSLPAFAAQKEETIHTTATLVYVHNLGCLIRAGGEGTLNERMITVLGEVNGTTNVIRSKSLELNHKVASATGCDIEKLDLISAHANNGFGFLHNVPLEIKKTTSESRRAPNGRCVADYLENLSVDLGNGVLLADELGELRTMTDCR
jgi:hypothetical protein